MTLQELFARFGVVILFVNALLHELAVPLPLTPTVLVAGAMRSEPAALVSLVAAVVTGSVIGNALWFAAGRRHGAKVLGFFCRFSLSPDTCVSRSADGFGRWGPAFIIVGRFLPGVSLIVPPVAGALGMRWGKFLALTVAGTTLWAVLVLLIGAALEQALVVLADRLATVPAGVWVAAVLLAAGGVTWRVLVRRRLRQALSVPRITPADLRAALQSSEPPVVIDVRGATMQQMVSQRIPGAIALSLEALETHPLPAPGVVLYCTCPHEASAAAGARILKSRGHPNPQALGGGLDAWISAGYEVEEGAGAQTVARRSAATQP